MRALRIVLVVVVVVAGLFVAADRIAVGLAEDKAADKIKDSKQFAQAGDVSVDIQGFPFLTQVAGKELDEVDAQLSNLTTSGKQQLSLGRVDARLRNVQLDDDYNPSTADRATGTATVSYKELSDAADTGVSVGYGGSNAQGKGRVKVTGELSLLGRTFKRSVESTVSVTGGNTIRLHADKVPGDGIPGIEDAVRKKTDFSRTIGGLPNGLTLRKVEPTKDGVTFSVTGSKVQLTG